MKLVTDSFTINKFYDLLPWSRHWTIVTIGLILLVFPLVLAWLTDALGSFMEYDVSLGRVLFPGIAIFYILMVIQFLQGTRENVALSLRPLLQIDEETFVSVVRHACHANPLGEVAGFGIGILFFVMIVGFPGLGPVNDWLSFYYYVISMIMFGATGWSVYAVIVITRLTNSLLRQPIEIDIFDVAPLEPIGRQSLYLSLSFLGATVLLFPSSPFPVSSWQNSLIFGILMLITLLVFFINMNSTHRLLAATKKQQLAIVENKIAQTYHHMLEPESYGQDTHYLATELNAWVAAKHELMMTRSWPYNTEMLRTLLISVLIPAIVSLARIITPLLDGS